MNFLNKVVLDIVLDAVLQIVLWLLQLDSYLNILKSKFSSFFSWYVEENIQKKYKILMNFPKYLEKIIENVGTVLLNLYYISLL